MKNVDLSIIIVSNNHQPFLSRCLTSMYKNQGTVSLEIFVVDNASTDTTSSYVKTKFPRITLIRRTKKFGFAANNNVAMKRARGKYMLLLNPDTEMTPCALQTLYDTMETHPAVGVCGPKLVFPNKTLQYSCRKFPTILSFFVRRTPLRTLMVHHRINDEHLLKHVDHSKTQPVDWLLGACLCIRKQVVKSVGFLDERFFLYGEDIDYCLRTWHAGWKVWYVPTATVIHYHQARSDKQLLSIYSLHHTFSMFMFVLKHGLFLRKSTDDGADASL